MGSVALTSQQRERVELARKIAARRARQDETGKNPVSRPSISTPAGIQEAVEQATPLRGQDAADFATVFNMTADAQNRVRLLYEEARWLSMEEAMHYACMVDMLTFCKFYLPHRFYEPMVPAFHGDLFDILQRVYHRRITKPVVIAGFPGCGKSMCVDLAAPLHNMTFGSFKFLPGGRIKDLRKHYYMFVSSIQEIAAQMLTDVLMELEKNEQIIEDFGHLYLEHNQKHSREWSARKAYLPTVDIYLQTAGRRTHVRSTRRERYRVDMLIGDDMQSTDSVESPTVSDQDLRWLTTDLIPRLDKDRGNSVFPGNLIGENSLVNKLLKHGEQSGWTTRVYRLYEEDPDTGEKKYLMPHLYGPDYEERKRDELMSEEFFEQEYLQKTDAGKGELYEKDFKYYDEEDLAAVREHCNVFLACDPGASSAKTSDPTAIVAVAFDERTSVSYVLPVYMARVNVHDQIDDFISECLKYRPHTCGIEAVAFQKVLRPLIEEETRKQGFSLNLVDIKQDTGQHKHKRIRSLFPEIQRGLMKFREDDPHTKELIRQLIMVGKGRVPSHDDCADALEMANRLRNGAYMEAYSNPSTVLLDIG